MPIGRQPSVFLDVLELILKEWYLTIVSFLDRPKCCSSPRKSKELHHLSYISTSVPSCTPPWMPRATLGEASLSCGWSGSDHMRWEERNINVSHELRWDKDSSLTKLLNFSYCSGSLRMRELHHGLISSNSQGESSKVLVSKELNI